MPTRAKRQCRHPGCLETSEKSFCDKHKRRKIYLKKRRRVDNRVPAHKRGYDKEWERMRAMHLRVYSNCQRCGMKGPKGMIVHHIPEYMPGTSHWDYQKITVCTSCHNQIHKKGKGNGISNRIRESKKGEADITGRGAV